MKKLMSYVLSASFIACVGVTYVKHLKDKKQVVVKTALRNAKAKLSGESIVGSWIDSTDQLDTLTRERVYVGAITTERSQFDFIANAQTGEIIYFEKAGADVF